MFTNTNRHGLNTEDTHVEELVEGGLGVPGDADGLVGAAHVADERRVRVQHRPPLELKHTQQRNIGTWFI